MKVSDSKDCVAYYYKLKKPVIISYIKSKGPDLDFEYLKRYILSLTDVAKKTAKQKSIRAEVESCLSLTELVSIIKRVIRNGDRTEFINY